MAIIAKNITVGVVKTAPTVNQKAPAFKDVKEHLKKKLEEKSKQEPIEQPKVVKKKLLVDPPKQNTKQLPKYIAKEEGVLTKKINTKSQYMRDIFDLDS